MPGGRLEIRAARSNGDIDRVFGLLDAKNRKTATLEEIDAAVAAGWSGRK